MILQDVLEFGIVGAGGAGFPTHVKLKARPEYLIVNAAECEPLFHKDAEILSRYTDAFLLGGKTAQELCGAKSVIIGIKKKHQKNIALLRSRINSQKMRIIELDDFFPAGDEVTLVYKTTGRVIQPGALPIACGCVVQNVETLYNLGKARPVTEKFVTISGAVEQPVTLKAPIGTSLRELLANVKITVGDYAVVYNGAMMGTVEENLDAVVTKRTGGLLILPSDHYIIRTLKRSKDEKAVNFLAKTACDQCSFCTDLCPRNLLGHPVRPNVAMRNLLFQIPDERGIDAGNAFCCDCNLCTLFSCPEHLDPRGACRMEKAILRKRKVSWQGSTIKPHPMAAYRTTSTSRLKERLGLAQYQDHAPLKELTRQPRCVRIPLSQHAGAPARACVKTGERVKAGDCIGKAAGEISTNVHASIEGKVSSVTVSDITIGE